MPPIPTSVLAFVTTVHVAMVALRKHRLPPGVFPWALLPSIVFCVAPWVFSTIEEVGVGLLVHLVWFVACEKLVPVPAATAASPAPARPSGGQAIRPAPLAPAAASRTPASPSREFAPVSVLAVIDDSPTIRTFRLVRPAAFTFQAGQFLTVRVQVDGEPHVRCYSISSAPEATGYMEISVKRQGLVSGTLHATVHPGSQLFVKPPAGRFVYPAHDDRPVVLVAGGVGITPLASMLRHAVVADPGRPVTLLYSARGSSELAFWDEISWLSRRHAHVRAIGTITEDCPAWRGRCGRIDEAWITKYVPDAAHSVFLMCGPIEMVRVLGEVLRARGVPESQIRSEVFQAAAAIGAKAAPAAAEPLDDDTATAVATSGRPRLVLVKSNLTVDVAGSQTLLDAAEAAGAQIPSLCRAGVCGTCRTRLVAGDAQCSSDALDDRDRQAGYVLPCVTWAHGDCSLEA